MGMIVLYAEGLKDRWQSVGTLFYVIAVITIEAFISFYQYEITILMKTTQDHLISVSFPTFEQQKKPC